MTSYSFGKEKRLLNKNDFKRVFDSGKRVHRPILIGVWSPSISTQSRLGLVVSKKVGNAVIRGRVKRKIREAFRLLSPELTSSEKPVDLVVIAKRQSAEADFEEYYRYLSKMLKHVAQKQQKAEVK